MHIQWRHKQSQGSASLWLVYWPSVWVLYSPYGKVAFISSVQKSNYHSCPSPKYSGLFHNWVEGQLGNVGNNAWNMEKYREFFLGKIWGRLRSSKNSPGDTRGSSLMYVAYIFKWQPKRYCGEGTHTHTASVLNAIQSLTSIILVFGNKSIIEADFPNSRWPIPVWV